MKTIIVDCGHGMGNRRSGVYDPGACAAGVTEAGIVMDWGNELRGLLLAAGQRVIRTRVDAKDPAPVGRRAAIARQYGGDIMISLHCNAANGVANGTETFYRGIAQAPVARMLNDAVVTALGTRDRGIKTEASSQHTRLAIMEFQPCFLIELGFIDHAGDRERMLNPELRRKACEALADVLLS
ncbi:N-acetylmuramoyl-L-alanine amidase [Prosthecobacter sp. SYSU 5D2]|uniref:N-acetylmuramoyl-L-alanine amidase family protein n=1 Tax=Prosthecobacter sp. SYSU 5D2 TaxID=3134134 RepID=UPI0031FEB2BD